MSKSTILAALMCLTIGSIGNAQSFPEPPARPRPPAMPGGFFQSSDNPMSKLAKAWLDSEDEDDREKISDKTYELLEEQFEQDMARREQELAAVVQRIDRLRSQLDKRANKKDDIIELQLKQVTMAWEGLGWAEPEGNRNNLMRLYTDAANRTVHGFTSTENSSPFNKVAQIGEWVKSNNPFAQVGNSKPVHAIVNAAVKGDSDELADAADRLAEIAAEEDPVSANDMIWSVYREVGDQVEDKDFWAVMAKAADDAADKLDRDDFYTTGNILDTAAHCHYLAGNQDVAEKLQKEAVIASAMAQGGEPDGEILAFLYEVAGEEGNKWTKSDTKKIVRKLRAIEDGDDESEDDEEGGLLD